jgi:hypothetical protein
MTDIAAASSLLRQAQRLTTVLDAAYGAFEELLSALWDHVDPGEAMFIPHLMAANCAANGRDAVLFAPSLPPRRLPTSLVLDPMPVEDSGEGADGALADLSLLLASRLADAATCAPDRGDRAACHDAAGYAQQIHDLLTAGSP